ncbi:hypothetical protein FAZ19_08765 [Sphingobacterium alkalisoli]|uniref:Uncharacterized protein n=1 Tax=Sphingobacterium alkalisoli TaxID=1874115 RepID=A0A4V5LYL0_9SPHI|nr:hypothetical protein [Sphingobacterium alkalisoli]TJY66979.1 hypothetical protein FAZ19_08765 [Sphingobacterium alkalisoli]GGH13010.1 hypothetical protein GCM10011418_12920 [Sphingobacterium alkalisoli]
MRNVRLKNRKLVWFGRFVLLFLLLILGIESRGQTKVLANEVTYTSGINKMTSLLGCGALGLGACFDPTVEDAPNALVDDESYARLLASPGILAGLASYTGAIELKFPQTLDANTWSYVRIAGDNSLFDALLGGSLGEVLGDVLGAVLVGNQEITIDARLGGTSVFSRSSSAGFGSDRVKMLIDKNGNYYLAIRPNSSYDRIRITNATGSLVGIGTEYALDVFKAFYYEDNGENCGLPMFTSFDGGGISLSVADVDSLFLNRAIDNDLDSYSELKQGSLLDVQVLGTLSQFFYFPTRSEANHTFNVKLSLEPNDGILNVDLLGGVQVIVYDGTQQVYTRTLSGGLLNGLDILQLFQNGAAATLTFSPGAAFDRIEVRLNSPVGLNLAGSVVRIHDVQRYSGIGSCVNPNRILRTISNPMIRSRLKIN